QPLNQFDVVLHRLVLAHALELGPGVVLGTPDEIEPAGTIAPDVTFGRLLVIRVELEQRRVVGSFLGRLRGDRCRLEFALRILRCGGHDAPPRDDGVAARFRISGRDAFYATLARPAS